MNLTVVCPSTRGCPPQHERCVSTWLPLVMGGHGGEDVPLVPGHSRGVNCRGAQMRRGGWRAEDTGRSHPGLGNSGRLPGGPEPGL